MKGAGEMFVNIPIHRGHTTDRKYLISMLYGRRDDQKETNLHLLSIILLYVGKNNNFTQRYGKVLIAEIICSLFFHVMIFHIVY